VLIARARDALIMGAVAALTVGHACTTRFASSKTPTGCYW
jgi:hypothetical protein